LKLILFDYPSRQTPTAHPFYRSVIGILLRRNGKVFFQLTLFPANAKGESILIRTIEPQGKRTYADEG
jgi:hypothetical protein